MDESTPSSPDTLQLALNGFEGPLDLLLELARRQRVDLARISITTLVDQYLLAIMSAERTDLIRAADWLVMATWLTWLSPACCCRRTPTKPSKPKRPSRP